MALVTEDGTGKADAESLCSVATADLYHAARGNADWAALATDAKEQALRKATDYMAAFRGRWKGWRTTSTQALDFPRDGMVNEDVPGFYGSVSTYFANDEVPAEVQQACAELALRASEEDLSPDIERATLREKVGSLEVEYDPNAPLQTLRPAVVRKLSRYLKSSTGGVMAKLVRS